MFPQLRLYGKYKPENIDPILLCASTAAPPQDSAAIMSPCRSVQQPGFPTSWSLHAHVVSDDPANSMFWLPLPGQLQQTHPLHPYTARVEGLHFGDGQWAVVSWVIEHRSREKPRGKPHPSILSYSTSQPCLLHTMQPQRWITLGGLDPAGTSAGLRCGGSATPAQLR